MTNNKIITEILDQIHAEGYRPGTPQFDFMFQKRRVERCRELRGVPSCQSCHYFDSCELVKDYLRKVSEIQMKRHVAMVEAEKKRSAEIETRIQQGATSSDQAPGIPGQQIPGTVGEGSGIISNTSWYPEQTRQEEPGQGHDGGGVQPAGGPGSGTPK